MYVHYFNGAPVIELTVEWHTVIRLYFILILLAVWIEQFPSQVCFIIYKGTLCNDVKLLGEK